MGHDSPAIDAAARAARVMATAFFVVGGLGVITAVVLTDYSRHPLAARHFVLMVLLVSAIYFVPAGLLLLLARRMERAASRWPFVTAMALACLAVAAVALQILKSGATGTIDAMDVMIGGCLAVLLGVPSVNLAVRCWVALPEVRFLRRMQAPGSSPPAGSGAPAKPSPHSLAGVKPPPPARQLRPRP